MTIAIGDRLPSVEFREKIASGPVAVPSEPLFAGRKVVLFAVPGAYTGTCSTMHVPSFIRTADAIRAKGIDEIVCVAVNDVHVLRAWSEVTGADKAGIRMLSDGGSEFTRALGLAYDNPIAGMFGRSRRYSMLVDDGIVRILNLEDQNSSCEISAGQTMLAQL